VRNTRATDVIVELKRHGVDVALHDPLVAPVDLRWFNVRVLSNPFEQKDRYDAVVLAVPHRVFQDQPVEAYLALLKNGGRPAVLVDVKGVMREMKDRKGVLYWSL
jgi:UDP-N-acetyl-D-galactosamine dehydrogenase